MSENVSTDEVYRLLETLDEWEEVALHLGLSDQTIQEIRGLSGGNSLRREVMVSRWVQCKDLEPSWSKLEEALVSANQEPYAAMIRARQRTPTNPAITTTASTTSSDDLKEASDHDSEKETEALLSTVNNKTLKEDDWNVVSVECGSLAAKWEQLSACLGLAKADIDTIRESRPRDIAGCWSEALSQWIKQNYSTQQFGLPSWRSLLKAVATVDTYLCKELAAKHPLVSSAIVQPPPSPEKRQQSVEMIRSNVEEIKALFSSLVLEVQLALQSQSDISNVRDFLITFFECDFPETSDVKKLFAAITLKHLWDYHHYSPLERLVNRFLPNHQEVGSLMKAYKARLSGFYLTTKLIDYIEYQNLSADDSDEECDQPSPKLTAKQYKKIKVVLQLERKISQVSLDYVVKLWQSFAEEYEIPSLTAVIDRIVAGSLEITWTVPQHIADAILPRSKFFRSHGMVLVLIDDIIIYDEKQMAAKEKRFLELCCDGTADIRDFSSLLAQGVELNIYNKHGHHPLWCISYHGRQDLVELFLKYRADIDMATKEDLGETALVTAVNKGHLHVAEILVKYGADVNYRNKKGTSVLCHACFKEHTEIVLLLLRHHAVVDLPNDNDFGNTALVAAVDRGHLRVAEILVENGADVNYRNKKGISVLCLASFKGHTEIVLLFLRHHAAVDLPNDNELGETALVAVCAQGHYDPAALLIDHGADVNYLIKTGVTPTYCAIENNHPRLVELLVVHGADINKGVQSPLYVSCLEGNIEMAQLLVHHHAAIDHLSDYGNSALQAACYCGYTDIVKLLIQSNANLELKNDEGRTGLMIAAWRGHSSIAAELVRAGAQIDVQDQNGLTAYDYASSESRTAVCQLLEQYGYKPSHLAPAPLQSIATSRQHDPITSLQTFRDILEHGSELSDTPKHQESDTAPQQHTYDELDETAS